MICLQNPESYCGQFRPSDSVLESKSSETDSNTVKIDDERPSFGLTSFFLRDKRQVGLIRSLSYYGGVNFDPLIPFFDSKSSKTDSYRVKIDDEIPFIRTSFEGVR